MPLVAAKCTNCGANLTVENIKDAAICEYCGTPFIVEKAINNYNITNNVSNNISGSVVNIDGANSTDFIIRAGTLEKYTGPSTEVVIPNTVTSIGGSAFRNCRELISVVIPDSVISIGQSAFKDCHELISVVIPNSVTSIDESAFENCQILKSINIPNSVTYIGSSAFDYCRELASINIPNSVTYIGSSAFGYCRELVSVNIPDSVTSIGSHAFNYCDKLVSVNIPDSVTSIEQFVFSHCPLESITIPDSVKFIGEYAFNGGNFESLSIPNSVTSIGTHAFSGCHRLNTVTISNNDLTKIDYDAFEGCYNITSVNPPNAYYHFHDSIIFINKTKEYNEAEARRQAEVNKKGCYLTTACMEHQSATFDDNCYELTVLRGFRDTYLKNNHPEDIKTYYNTAPAIVETINTSPNADSKWQEVYKELVEPSLRYIENQELDKAYQHYKNYSLMLEKQYLS